MTDHRNRDPHPAPAAPAGAARGARPGFPLPRRHRRLLAACGAAAALLLGGLSAGTALQASHDGTAGAAGPAAAAPAGR
ncbi:hypothetical protein [Streptomyces sp. NPDC001380]|uniref:hypothetical protein n=1 Tax=Streptomyces sp. NPDC001380 TaxID=3364566 RepID=UPI00367390D0